MESKSVIRSGVADSLLIESYPSFITILLIVYHLKEDQTLGEPVMRRVRGSEL